MHEGQRRALGRGLLALGSALLLYCLCVWLDARMFQGALARRLDSFGRGGVHATPLRRASASRREALASGLVGQIEIPRAGIRAMIVEGTTSGALQRGVGHVTGSAFPGEIGNVALAAHRDSYFARLGKVAVGDVIRLRTPDGTFAYRVDSILIVAPDRGDLLRATRRPRLTLVTCYPFHWIGPAPRRYVVQALAVGGATPRPARSRAAGAAPA